MSRSKIVKWSIATLAVVFASVGLWFLPTATTIAIIGVSAAFIVWRFLLRSKAKPARESGREKRRKEKLHKGERVGLYLSPIRTNLVLRPALSILAGAAIALVLYAFAWVVGSGNIFPWWAALSLAGILSAFFALNDEKAISVPKTHVAILTFLGVRFRIYLEEGDHYWYGEKIGFARSEDPMPVPASEGEKKGFVYTGKRPIEIYERSTSGEKTKNLTLANVAADFTEVRAKLTITLQVMDPLSYANSADPILDAAERARSGLRTTISFFTGVDNAVLKSSFSDLLGGKKFLTALSKKAVGVHPRGSVIQNQSGAPIFDVVPSDTPEEDVNEVKTELRNKIRTDADQEMIDALPKDSSGEIIIQEREVEDHLVPAMDAIGAHFTHASVSDFSLSKEVADQANKAASESFQRIGQVLSAQTLAEVRGILAAGLNEPGNELATLIAAAKDGHAEIIVVPGADSLTRAAVAGAAKLKPKK